MNNKLLGCRLVWSKATVFEIVITGSNPVTSAKFNTLFVYRFRTVAFQVAKTGSIPVQSTNQWSVFPVAGCNPVGIVKRGGGQVVRFYHAPPILYRRVHLGVIPDCLSGRGGSDSRLRCQVSAYMSSQCCGGNDGSISQSTQREIRRLTLPVSLECGEIPTVDANSMCL